MVQQWKTIDGFENYQVSTAGRIRCKKRHYSYVHWKSKKKCSVEIPKKVLKGYVGNDGYVRMCLFKNGKQHSVRVNRIVAKAFVSNPNDLPLVMHLDDNKLNNKANNLKWGTIKDNAIAALESGIFLKGETHPRAKLTEEKVRAIKNLIENKHPVQLIADDFGVGKSTINKIRRGELWKHLKL